MDPLQQYSTIAAWGWQAWVYALLGTGIGTYLFLFSHKMYKKVIVYFEKKYNVSIVARYKYYQITGPYSWQKLMWIEIKLFFTFFMVYFAPFVLIGVVGLLLGIFER